MSKKAKNNKFTYKPTQSLVELKKIKTEWDLKKLFYTSEKDPQFEIDIKKTEKAYTLFAKKYSDGKWRTDNKKIIKALKDYVALGELPGSKALYYLFYRTETNSEDTKAERLANKLEQRLTKVSNETIFFTLQLGKLSRKKQRELLSDSKAAPFHFLLKSIFDTAHHDLSEAEEKIMSLKSQTSSGMWINATQKILSKKTIKWKGKEMSVNGAIMQVENLPRSERHKMWNMIVPVLEELGQVAENELTALVTDKKVNDDLRGYEKPYSATTLAYDSTDETLETLVRVMETDGYKLANRFFKIKKKLLGRELTYIDRNEPIGKVPEIPFTTAVEIVRDVYYGFNPEYGKFFDEMLRQGQIDVWPKKGKGGGAFCSSSVNQPTLVFLNQNDSLDSLRTIAHEMGHAVHAIKSKGQPSWYQGHSVLTAETASTFFESLVSEHLIENCNEKDRLVFLHNSIADRLMTMVMCIARFNFELEMHETIRREGAMSWKELAIGLSKHLGKYAGPAIKMDYRDGLSALNKIHYRNNFYQYSYSFGEIGSSIMRSRYKADKTYAEQVDHFLSLGDSASVEDIFKSVGIDMSKEETYKEGLKFIEKDIDTFEQLAKKK